jgi:hypothetical protein
VSGSSRTERVLPPLPSWSAPPADVPAAIRQLKAALQARIEASGRSVDDVVGVMERRVRDQVEEVEACRRAGETAWPVIEFEDLAVGAVPVETIALVRRRGCVVVRGHFDRDQALAWDASILGYVERNRFFDDYRGPGDDFFSSVDSKPEIYPIYWSPAQMEARQSDRMVAVQRFLNGLWRHESEGRAWFDPAHLASYPDRIRRRPEGTTSGGLGAHLDAGTLDLWMTGRYQQAFRHLFDGTPEDYDPWDAAYRTDAPQYPGTTMCSAFRTFQGWTALSDMDHDQGVLHSVPIADAMGYLLLRPLLDDVPEDELCGVALNRAFPVSEQWHSFLLRAMSGIPDVRAGDSAWWHCDLVHGVAPVEDQRGWGNVMYIPAAPWCPRNETYAAAVRVAFLAGASPPDFPAEHYEAPWPDRFGIDDLNATGRRALGLA